MEARQKVYDHLKSLGVEYQLSEHPAVYTVEEMEKLELDKIGVIIKNLFLRDASGKRHFLVMLRQDKKADLKRLREKIGSSALRFASPERLKEYLDLEAGSVGPFGLLHENAKNVELVIDRDLMKCKVLGAHPNDNRATVWLPFSALEIFLKERGNAVIYVEA